LPVVFFLQGPPLSGKTTEIMKIMAEKHKIDPFSYTFIGPSGYYVREFADRFVKLAGSIVRKNFYAVDQFAVEIYRDYEPQMLHINEDFEKVLLSSRVLDNMEGLDSSIKRSPNFVNDLLEVIRDIKEKGEDYLERLPDEDIYITVVEAYKRLKDQMAEMKLFDSFDAYDFVSKIELPHGFKGKYLFIDGFYDFTPIMSRMFKNIFHTFDEIYITCTVDDRRIFNQASTIVEFVNNLGDAFTVVKQRIDRKEKDEKFEYLMSIFGGSEIIDTNFADLQKYPNKHFEVENLCKEIKRMLTEKKYEPGDIAIVLNDFHSYRILFTRRLESYGIPYRLEGDFKLSESFIVNLLLLPLEVVSKDYLPELILSMIDFGYFSEVDPAEFESVFLNARIITISGRSRAKQRKEQIIEKLQEYQKKIKKRIEQANSSDEIDEDYIQQLEDEYEMVEKVKKGVRDIFENFLEPFGKGRMEVENYRKLFIDWIKKLELEEKLLESSQVDQLIALKNFIAALEGLEVVLKSIGKKRLGVTEYRKYLYIFISSVNYKPSLEFDNRIELLSLEASRFKTKKVKIFVGFNDGIYPKVENNLFYSGDNFSDILGTRYYSLKENQQKLSLFISMSKTTEKVLFTYPAATVEGEPLLLSSFCFELFPTGSGKFEKSAELITEPSSITELKTKYILSNYPEHRVEDIETQTGLKDLIHDFDRRLKEDVYKIKDVQFLKELIGNRFSYSKISTFEKCPRKFFYRYVLKIPERFEKRFEFTPFQKGSIYHSVLARIFKWLTQNNYDLIEVYTTDTFKNEVLKILKEEIEKQIYFDAELIKNIELEYFREYIENIIEKLAREENLYGVDELDETLDFVPKHFEISFGYSSDKVIVKEKDFEIELIGRIDRIDVSKDNRLFLIDYKTSSTDAKKQLMFYTLSLTKLDRFKNHRVYGGCTVVIENNNGKGKISNRFKLDEYGFINFPDGKAKKTLNLEEFERNEIMENVRQIYDGYFDKNDKTNCYVCLFMNLCTFFGV